MPFTKGLELPFSSLQRETVKVVLIQAISILLIMGKNSMRCRTVIAVLLLFLHSEVVGRGVSFGYFLPTEAAWVATCR